MAGKGKGMSGRTSRWLWGLLARLPDVGELGSEEVGVVREVGKKAVWVGVGLQGVDVSALDGGDRDEEEEEVLDMVVEDGEAETGAGYEENEEDDLADDSADPIIGPVQPPDLASSKEEGRQDLSVSNVEEDDPEALSIARARMLERLHSSAEDEDAEEEEGEAEEVNIEPEETLGTINGAEDTKEDILNNTRATVDMIITIVGELYGQRDLLEYREVWE